MGGGGGGHRGWRDMANWPNTISVSEMLFKILQGALSDLESYLSHSDEDLVCFEEAVNTPVHNIAAEQEVGMVSAAKQRMPGATMIFCHQQ